MSKIRRLNEERKSYKIKNEYLENNFEEVNALDFYREIFPEGSFERKGCKEDLKANGILTVIGEEKSKNRLIFDDLEEVINQQKEKFVITSAVSYSGRRRTASNARWLYGITIDLDGVNLENLKDFFHQVSKGIIGKPTFVCNSGHGIHIYYIFKKPIALYSHIHEKLRLFKYELIARAWNPYTSTLKKRSEVQYQGIFQGFRMVGTQTKLGKQFLVRAFRTGEKIDILDLNPYLQDKKYCLDEKDFHYQSKLSLHQAKIRYPEWYSSRIEKKQKKGRWTVKRDLYDWWKRKILEGATVGHRYSCMTVLCAYAIKCEISKKELEKDCMEILPILDNLSDSESNRFTKRDVYDALHFYDEVYVNFSRKEAQRVSGIEIPANKRNGLKQANHLEIARAIQVIKDRQQGKNWREGNGRPKGSGTKEHIIKEWRVKNPKGTKAQCIKKTGLSKPTVYKYWEMLEK